MYFLVHFDQEKCHGKVFKSSVNRNETKTIYFDAIVIFPIRRLYIKWPFSVCEKKTDCFHVGLVYPIIFYQLLDSQITFMDFDFFLIVVISREKMAL